MSRYMQDMEVLAYRVYVSDAAKALLEGVCGAKIACRYIDLIRQAPVDDRSAEEIIEHVVAGAGLKCKGREGINESV